MTIRITKKTLALCVVALALLIPATAYATHVFDDVADNRFFAEPVAWAAANDITTGTSPTTFEPDRNVTRGESVTFLKRYDDNIVQPALADRYTKAETDAAIAAVQADVDALGPMYWAAIAADGSIIAASAGVNTDVAETQRFGLGEYEVDFNLDAVANCHAMVSRSDTTTVGVTNGEVYAELRAVDASSIYVNTTDSTGADADSPFTLQLWCSPAVTPLALNSAGAGPAEGQGN